MTNKKLVQWSGLAAVVGSVVFTGLIILTQVLLPEEQPMSVEASSGAWILVWALFLMALILVALGLIGIYAYQAEEVGAFGLGSFLVAFTGMALVLGFAWAFLFVVPTLAQSVPAFLDNENNPGPLALAFPITFALFDGGLLLLGLATARAAVLPRWAGALLAAGAVLDFFGNFLPVNLPLGSVLIGVGLAWLGYAVWVGDARPLAVETAAAG